MSRTKKVMTRRDDIPTPTSTEVEKYLARWNENADYCLREEVLDRLFVTYPKNNEIHEILLKATVLNSFYSTNIFRLEPVARHILALNIDERLRDGDESLVKDLQFVTIKDKAHNFYSFTTKSCSFQNPEAFPLYDSYLEKILAYFRDVDGFYEFRTEELKDFSVFKAAVLKFREFYQLNQYSMKQIDQYLWQLGKEKFPKNY